jgi:hypothetical protein
MYLLTTSSHRRQAMIRRTIRRHHQHRQADHPQNTPQQRHSHPHHRHPLTLKTEDDGIPEPPPKIISKDDPDDLKLQHLNVRNLLMKIDAHLTNDFKLQ